MLTLDKEQLALLDKARGGFPRATYAREMLVGALRPPQPIRASRETGEGACEVCGEPATASNGDGDAWCSAHAPSKYRR